MRVPWPGHVAHRMHKDGHVQKRPVTSSGKTHLGTESAARAMKRMETIVTMPVVQVIEVVDPESRVVAAIICQDRIVAEHARLKVQVAVNVTTPVQRIVEITKVVMRVTRPHEHVKTNRIQVHHAVRPVDKNRARDHGGRKIDWGVELPSQGKPVIPVPSHKDRTSWRRDIMVRYPGTIGTKTSPVSWSPKPAGPVDPATGNPEVILRGRGGAGAKLESLGWLFSILDLALGRGLPESGNPLEPVSVLMPVARHPAMSLGWITPDTTDPNVILSFIIPTPVPRNPDDISLLGLVFRGFFRNRFGRGLGNNDPGLGVLVHLLRKCLMKRPACQDLHTLLSLCWVCDCLGFLLPTQCGNPKQQDHERNQDHSITG